MFFYVHVDKYTLLRTLPTMGHVGWLLTLRVGGISIGSCKEARMEKPYEELGVALKAFRVAADESVEDAAGAVEIGVDELLTWGYLVSRPYH